MSNSVVSQNSVQVLHSGGDSNSIVSQHVVQVLIEAPSGLWFRCDDCTNLINDTNTVDITESGLSWAILDNQAAASVTAIAEQNNNLNIENGVGFVKTETAPGTYLVIVQNGTGSIGAYVMDVF
jgi:hypothetical protein